MKQNIKNLLILFLFLILLSLIFLNRDIVTYSVKESITLFETKVFPFLFIMFIIQDILISYNLAYYFSKLLGNTLKKIFKLSNEGQMIFLLSLISGSPASAYIINKVYKENKISKDEANKLLKFTYFANPLFVYNILVLMFTEKRVIKLMIIIYASNFLIAYFSKSKNLLQNKLQKQDKTILSSTLITSIKTSINTLLTILGCIIYFMIITNILVLFIDNDILKTIFKGFMEITNGLNSLVSLNITSKIKEIIAVSIISFGGLSIHLQVLSLIYQSNLSYSSFLKGRVLSTIICILLVILF